MPGDSVPLLEVDPPKMVGLGRLELPTSPLSGVRSNHLSYRPQQWVERRIVSSEGAILGLL